MFAENVKADTKSRFEQSQVVDGKFDPAVKLRECIRDEGVPLTFSRSEFILHQGKAGGQVYLIEDGIVAITHRCINDHRQIYDFLFPPSLLLPTLGESRKLAYSAECLTDVSAHVISQQSLDRILRANPEYHFGLQQELGLVLERTQSHLSNIMCRQGEERVSFMLAQLHKLMTRSGGATRAGDWIGVTQIDLASSVGMTPVYINQIIKKLKASGAIASNRGKIKVVEPELLESQSRL
ncbi:Crp/Fnr family transcriptional regulator [Altererythrobacter aquiaggeris]|uniref:Crp/Fnr family transcriptional regulator n=1 Tax=Aestuarierythrobacter aquiaggeris TaxID=1898396 RepID=UPI00301B46E5